MGKKIKLTTEQVKKIQEYKDKKITVSEEQYLRLKEHVDQFIQEGVDYKPTANNATPAANLGNQFKKAGKSAGIKLENEKLTGHPVGGDGGDEYNPQSVEANEKTFEVNESIGMEILNFTQSVLTFLKEMLSDPSQAGLSTIWVKMGVTRGELFSLMADIGIIGYVGHKLVVKTSQLAKKIKRLYQELVNEDRKYQEDQQSASESSISLGNDIEVSEDSTDMESNIPDPINQPEPKSSTPREPKFKRLVVIYNNGEITILKNKTGQLYIMNIDNMDKAELEDYADVPYQTRSDDEGQAYIHHGDFEITSDVISRYVNDNIGDLSFGITYDDYANNKTNVVRINNDIAKDILNSFGDDKIMQILGGMTQVENVHEAKMSPNFRKLKDKTGKIRKLTKKDGDYKASEGDNKCGGCKYFKKNGCDVIRGTIDKEMVCNYYDKKKSTSETTVAGASGDGGSSGPFVTPKVWAKNDKNWANAKKPMYPSGQIVATENFSIKLSKEQFKLIKESNLDSTAWPDGEFVEFDDCVKFNNNKDAINGKCSTGAVDGVVKTKKTKESMISDKALYYEIVAKKTGRTIDEVRNIVEGYDKNKE